MEVRYLIPKPAAVYSLTEPTEQERGAGDKAHCSIYVDDHGQRLYWSAPFPVPDLGDKVTITMNSIGRAVVVGYFEEGGYLGVMTKATNPPKWLVEQRARDHNRADFASKPQWYKDGIGCEFGSEIKL